MQLAEIHRCFQESNGVCTDTRKLVEGGIFFALKGASFNGNEYALVALEGGCSWAVVDEDIGSDDRLIKVNDVLSCLQDLANFHRKELQTPIIAITGSNGKTTTKELMYAVLSQRFETFATEGNLNNHIGVPLSLLSINKDTDLAIIEMGANHQKEIELLCQIAEPDYGIITNIGQAHLKGFGGIEGVISGKGELFDYLRDHMGTAFVNTDLDHLEQMSEGVIALRYSTSGAPYYLNMIENDPTLAFSWTEDLNPYIVRSNLTGEYNLHNFAAAIAVGRHLGVNAQKITEALSQYVPSNHRSQVTDRGSMRLILDSYNANPSSMAAALNNLAHLDAEKKFFVIGDMLELGDESMEHHEDILALADNLELEGITVGSEFGKVAEDNHHDDSESAGAHMASLNLEGYTILIKGSRGIKLEKVLDFLPE